MATSGNTAAPLVAVIDSDADLRSALTTAVEKTGIASIGLPLDALDVEDLSALGLQILVGGLGAAFYPLLQLAQQIGQRRSLLAPAVLYTGIADPGLRSKLLAAGAVCVLGNASPAELAEQVSALLRQRLALLESAQEMIRSHEMLAQLQEDLRLGARIQQSFLPPLSISTPAFTLEARIQASWTLSGDFFDYKFITPERLAVFIADISGHGVASALLASRLKAFFDEHYRNARRPARTLELLNRMLIELGEHQQFATAVLLCLDVSEGNLIYANAGHRTLYLLDREQGHYTPLPSSGPALGLFEDCEIAERDFSFLPRRKRLVAYTDGLVEFKSLSHGEWVSEDEFIEQLILPALGHTTAGFTDAVFTGSLKLSGGEKWDDDVCLVVVDC